MPTVLIDAERLIGRLYAMQCSGQLKRRTPWTTSYVEAFWGLQYKKFVSDTSEWRI